jgi:hypothetical protein
MDKLERKKIDKLYKKVDELATGGYSNIYEYYKFINDIIDRGDYSYFKVMMNLKYKIDFSLYETVESGREISWKEVMFQTRTSYDKKIKKLFERKNVYMVGLSLYDASNNCLGDMKELDAFYDKKLESWTSNYPPYLNRIFAKLTGDMTTFIEVKKPSATYSIIVDDFNFDRDELNLLDRYETAINYLLGNLEF